MKLGTQWVQLSDNWSEARIRVLLDDPERMQRAAQLLAPLGPVRGDEGTLTFGVVGHSDTVKRLFDRLDGERIRGTVSLVSSDPKVDPPPELPAPTLRESWEAALATLPADWSDLLAEVELLSSDWMDKAAVNLVPLNPRREGDRLAYRFRAARRFGYGASMEMVARCLSRCDDDGMHGTTRVLRALSGTRPVQTQGPVWLLDGRTV